METNENYYANFPLAKAIEKYDEDVEVAINLSKDFKSLDFLRWLGLEWRDPNDVYDMFDEKYGFRRKEIVSNCSYYANDLVGALKKYDEDYSVIIDYNHSHPAAQVYEPTFWEWCQKEWEWRDPTKKVKFILGDSNSLRWVYE